MVRIRLIDLIGIYRLHDFLQSFLSFSSFPMALVLELDQSFHPKGVVRANRQGAQSLFPMDGEGSCSPVWERKIPRGLHFQEKLRDELVSPMQRDDIGLGRTDG